MSLTERLVSIAQEKLENQPFDEVHNLDHHTKVWGNCKAILESESLDDLDQKTLEVACWWHDIERGTEDNATLDQVLQENGAQSDFAQKVRKVVDEHTFGAEQTCLESEVLYDADKLEYLSIDRFDDLMKMSEEKIKHYISASQERISEVWNNLHFPSSREEFKRRFKEISKFAKDYPVLLESVKAIDLDFFSR